MHHPELKIQAIDDAGEPLPVRQRIYPRNFRDRVTREGRPVAGIDVHWSTRPARPADLPAEWACCGTSATDERGEAGLEHWPDFGNEVRASVMTAGAP